MGGKVDSPGGRVKAKVGFSIYWWMVGFNVIRQYAYSPLQMKKLLDGEKPVKRKPTSYEYRVNLLCMRIIFIPKRSMRA